MMMFRPRYQFIAQSVVILLYVENDLLQSVLAQRKAQMQGEDSLQTYPLIFAGFCSAAGFLVSVDRACFAAECLFLWSSLTLSFATPEAGPPKDAAYIVDGTKI